MCNCTSSCNCSTTITSGDRGWSPLVAIEVVSATREVLKVIGWTGGTGTPPSVPSSPNNYMGASGFTTQASAVNIRGTDGTNGVDGVSILYSYVSTTGTGNDNAIGESTLGSYTVLAGEVGNDGDELEFNIHYEYSNNDQVTIRLKFGGSTFYTYDEIASEDTKNKLKLIMSRITRTSQLWTIERQGVFTSLVTGFTFGEDNTSTTVDLANANLFEITGDNLALGANQVVLKKLVIKKYTI